MTKKLFLVSAFLLMLFSFVKAKTIEVHVTSNSANSLYWELRNSSGTVLTSKYYNYDYTQTSGYIYDDKQNIDGKYGPFDFYIETVSALGSGTDADVTITCDNEVIFQQHFGSNIEQTISNLGCGEGGETYEPAVISSANLPYQYGFESVDIEGDGWKFTNNADIAAEGWILENWNIPGIAFPSEGQKYSVNYTNSSYPIDSWSISRALNLQAGKEVKVLFDYYGMGSNMCSTALNLAVTVGESQDSESQNTQLWSKESIKNTTYEEGSIIFTPQKDGIYYVGFHNYSGTCNTGAGLFLDDIRISYNSDLAVTDAENGKVKIIPNPAQDTFKINSDEKVSKIEIINTAGQVIFSSNNTEIVTINHLSKGVYFVKIYSFNGKISIEKLIKE